MNPDISPDFRYSEKDAKIIQRVLKHKGTGKAIRTFSGMCRPITNYGYWFTLGSLWVDYTGWSDLAMWRALFGSKRPQRETSLMKPSELRAFNALPGTLRVFRAHRPGETEWISFTLSLQRASHFASLRGVAEVVEYTIPKAACIALFLRRDEYEIIALDAPRQATRVQAWKVVESTPNTCVITFPPQADFKHVANLPRAPRAPLLLVDELPEERACPPDGPPL